MSTTFPVMAMYLLLGQTTDVPATPPAGNAKVYIYSGGNLVPVEDAPKGAIVGQPAPAVAPAAENNHPIRARIKAWFNRRSIDSAPLYDRNGNGIGAPLSAPQMTPTPNTMPPAGGSGGSSDFPHKLPTIQQGPPVSGEMRVITDPSSIQPATLRSLPTPVKSPILPVNAERIGRDDKFTWVTGQLEIEKGQPVLYYATPETVDTHGGRITLAAQKVDLSSFRSGDLISVQGRLATGLGGPVYQLTNANLIDRPRQ
jgi:hypothetical protein